MLVKVLNSAGDWGLAVRVTDRQGEPLVLEQVERPEKMMSRPGADEALEFVALFDGETFEGWEGDTEKSFRIEDGAIVGGSLSAPIPRNEFLCTTRRYENFVLRLECKVIEANGGIQFRSERIPDSAETRGYQADMDSSGTYWGCVPPTYSIGAASTPPSAGGTASLARHRVAGSAGSNASPACPARLRRSVGR